MLAEPPLSMSYDELCGLLTGHYKNKTTTTTVTTTNVIGAFRVNVAIFGLPEHIATDNGTQFTGGEFKEILNAM